VTDDVAFDELIRRLRSGDEGAATQLVRTYEPVVRRFVRVRLAGSRLRRVFDSMDVCQEVLASFFVRAALGQFDLDAPQKLVNLLVTMARNKVASKARRRQPEQANSPDGPPNRVDEDALPTAGPTPSQEATLGELFEGIRRHLSDDELRLADLRADGKSWEEIAAEFGDSPEALRKRLARAIDRVARRFDLEAASDE
jgi:RNA polymerase sigma-70 factor (ECF subfamily)